MSATKRPLLLGFWYLNISLYALCHHVHVHFFQMSFHTCIYVHVYIVKPNKPNSFKRICLISVSSGLNCRDRLYPQLLFNSSLLCFYKCLYVSYCSAFFITAFYCKKLQFYFVKCLLKINLPLYYNSHLTTTFSFSSLCLFKKKS